MRGEVLIKSYTASPQDIASYGLLVEENGDRQFEITKARLSKKGLVATLAGVTDRNAAEALKGVVLCVARDALPEPNEDEYYHADLIGLEVRDEAGTPIGSVVAIQDFGAGELVDIRLAGTRGTVLLPFTREVVPEVDVAGGFVVVCPPPGLLDDESPKDSDADGTET